MTPEETKQAQDLIDAVAKGTAPLKPSVPVFPADQARKAAEVIALEGEFNSVAEFIQSRAEPAPQKEKL
jgi:hypothetical protein